jgi:hypothetical protein
MEAGDFFGLDLFKPEEKNEIYLKVRHEYQGDLSVDISYDGVNWVCFISPSSLPLSLFLLSLPLYLSFPPLYLSLPPLYLSLSSLQLTTCTEG